MYLHFCGGIDAKNVIVHMVTINQELRHEQIVVFNMIDPKFFARIYFCKIATRVLVRQHIYTIFAIS